MSVQIDLTYRPATYWPGILDQEQLLTRIQGQARRDITRQILAEDGVAGLDAIITGEILADEDRRDWGLLHPHCMGGEYLPQLDVEDIEIARISLASTTSDQISIRASRAGETIRYSVCDEYDTEFELAFAESEQALTLGELIALIDGSKHPEEEQAGGLLVCHWENMISWGESADAAVDFAWIQSAWYPQLTEYYEQFANDWRAQKESELDGDDDDEEQPQTAVTPIALVVEK